MRVFCPEHKRGFFAPRQSPIKCENRGHVLGEMNFTGEARTEVDLQWQYCCNCEHFCPISPAGETLDRCPVCTRRTSLLYICDRCFTISFESNTPLGSKNFTLTSEGLPQPACPTCLQTNAGEVREHACDQLGASFTTALNSCPICGERLDIGPAFPMLVAEYLKRIKSAHKLSVTFDYDTGLFVAVEDGEFVLVTGGAESKQAMVLPRLPRFSSPREFYEIYQDYYHHSAELKPGEVWINEPALAEKSGEGWKFQAPGSLEVVDAQPKTKPRNKIRLGEIEPEPTPEPAITPLPRSKMKPSEIEMPAAEAPAPPSAPSLREKMRLSEIERAQPAAAMPAKNEGSAGHVCDRCGEVVEDRYAFCWHCGNPMKAAGRTGEKRAPAPPSPRRLVIDVDDASTVDPEREDKPSAVFSPGLSNKPKKMARGGNSALKLMVVTIVTGAALLVATTGVFWLRGWASPANSGLVSQAATANLQSDQPVVPTVPAADKPVVEPTQAAPVARPGEDELRKMRLRRIGATAADRPAMLRDFARTERQYPSDYRFPYERAKLALIAPQAKSYEAAFQALALAAEKAIRMGQAQDMLRNLEADKNGDFRKLSHGHPEWGQLVQALKSRDVKLLTAGVRGQAE